METKNLSLFNLNRRGSGANLNLFRSVAMVLVLLTLDITNAWGNSDYYSQAGVAVKTGAGTVYVGTSTSYGTSTTGSSVTYADKKKTNAGSAPTDTWYIKAVPDAGYTFTSWTTGGSWNAAPNKSTAIASGTITASTSTAQANAQANFTAVSVSSAPANIDLAPTDPSAIYPVETSERTLTFTTSTSNALTDFTNSPANGASGKFTFSNWRRVDATHVAVDYQFTGGGSYGGVSRTNSVTVSLKGVAHSTTKSCTITANFPNAKITDGSADEVFATYKSTDATQAGVEKTAVFDVEYVDGTNNFDTPTFTGAGASHFTYNSMSYADGKLTVNYTYNGNKEAGTHVATLTLKVNNAIGGTDATYGSKAITITAHNEEEATNDASVTPAGGSATEYATFAQALAAANGLTGSTLTLLRNVNLGTITATNNINKAMTIDLNGKELRAAVDTKQVGVLTINANVAVTIKDSKTGGRIINEHSKNAVLYTINVAKGTLNLESGTICIHNTLQQSYGTAAAGGVATSVVAMGARAIQQAAATTVNINGGRVESYGTRAVYGIRTEGSKANTTTLNISGGEIYAEAPAYVYAVFSNGKLNVSGGTITAKINNEVVNENTAYMEYIRTNNKLWDNRTYGLRGFGYGILLQGGNSVTATSNYFGTLNMTGGTVNVINVGDPEMQAKSTATDFIQSPLYGVYFNAAALNVKTGTASDGSYSQKYAAKGSITGGTVNVTNNGRQSYGVWVTGNYNSFDNSYAPVELKNCTINVSSYYESYGVYATAVVGTTSDNASPNMGACYAGEVELTGATVTATTTTAATAYALFAHAVVGNVYKNATWTKAKNAGYPRVYDGEFGAAAKITVNSGTYTATSATTTAYAVVSTTRAKTTLSSETSVAANRELGGNAEAYPVLILHGGTFRGETGTTTSGAVLSGGYTTIDGGTYTAYSGSTTSRGIYATAGTLDVSNVEISASGTTTAYGIDLSCGISDYTGFKYYADATLKNLTVTATTRTGNEADAVLMEVTKRPLSTTTYNALTSTNKTNYGAIYQYGEYAVGTKCSIIGGTYKATSAGTTAYGVRMNSAAICEDVNGDGELAIGAAELSVKNATFTVAANGGKTAYGIWAGGPATIENSSFTVTTSAEEAWGIRARYGKTTISNSTIDVTAGTATARGIYVDALMSAISTSNNTTHFCGVQGFEITGELESNNNTITAKANGGNTAYGIQVVSAKGQATQTTAEKGLAFKGDHACAGKATINGGKYTATASGTTAYAIVVSDPAAQGEVTATPECIVNDGKFYGYATGGTYADVSLAGETGYFVLNGGYYVKDENLDKKLGEGMNKVAVKSGTPEYTEGYRWRVTDNMTGEIVCKVYNSSNSLLKSYQTLEEALAYVNLPANSSTAMTIVMCGNYTLSKGDYSLPNGKTLLVPYKASGTGKGATQAVGTSYVWVNYDTKFIKPTPLYKLTFASGVNMTVQNGAAIEASSVIYITNGASGQGASLLVEGTGIVHDKYGWIDLEEGSHIDLESGSNLYVWGYITGKGEINAKNGSKIYEDFQMGDWRGGTVELAVQGNKNGMNSKGVFPITHYYYQNIECPITYRAGATAYALGGTAVNAFGATNAITDPAVQFIGTSNSMFLMDPATAGEDTWVRKEYDPETDYMNWTLNSGASIGSISLKMSALGLNINLNSSDYVLPITSNFNIIANYGQVEISNDVCFIPGSKLTIKKEATVIIPSGKRVYFYDQDDWKSYSGYWFNPGYSPSWKTNPRRVLGANTSIKMPDAAVLVEGVLDIRGYAYTTAGGANIYSTRENAGKVKFTAAAPASTAAVAEFTGKNGTTTTLCQLIKAPDSTPTYEGKALNAPWLKNEDGAFSQTTGTTTNKTWIYMEDDDHVYRWILSYEDGCFTYKNNGGGEKQLIHPSDWVAAEINTNGDHAYHSEDGTRMFVNAKAATSNAGCVWWEVDPTPEIISGTTYYVANNENFDNFGTYFYWDNSNSYWVPKKITVTWNNWDGSKLTNGTYGDEYSFNTSPVYQGTNPTRANTTTEKYDWIGWRDAEGNIYDKNATLPRATSNVTYTAYFVATKYQHTITFKNKNDNKVIWSGLMDAGTIPVCPVAPTQDPTEALVYTFTNWEGYAANADLPTVTEPATYTAIYSSVPRQYHVTFYNYDAASVLYEVDVDYNTRPVYGGVTPFRSNTSAFSYEWTGWQGATHYGTTADLAFVTGDVYYVATFSQTDLKYQVLFKRQDGSIIDAPFFEYEETPEAFPANPTLASTVSTDYTFREWSPATLVPVTEDGKVYTALFDESPRQYTAHFVNYNGTSLNVDQTIDYNTVPAYTGATPFKPNDSRNSFEFAGWAWEAGADWAAGSIGVGEAFPAIKGDITFTAQFTETLLQFNIIYKREDGTVIEQQKKKWGESTAFPSVSNYEDATHTYTFDHWSPATVVTPVTTDATYTAYFNQGVKTYSISNFSISPAGYGTVSPASVTGIPSGAAVTVNGNTFTVNGTTVTAAPATATAQYTYAFDHWNNVPATVTGNVTNIEAVFTRTARSYTLSWVTDGDVLTGGYTSGTVAYGTAITAPNTPTKTGYVFAGWHNGTSVVTPATTMPAANTTYTAQWTAVTYSVRFNKNDEDATGTMSNESFTYDVAKALTSNAFTKTGYNFAGWATSAGGNVVYTDGQSVSNLSATQGAVVDMYAKWTVATYEVALNANGGTGGSTSVTMTYNSVDHTAITNPTRTGYTFHSWNTTVSSSTRKQVISSKGVMSENVSGYTGVGGVWIRTTMPTTLYARWSQKSYTTTFTHNGNGSISYDGAVVNAGGTAKVYHVSAKSLVATPNTGYHFTGWTVSGTNASKVTIADLSAASTTIKATAASATVTAGFAPDEYTISYKDQGDAEFSGVHGSGHPTTHTYGTATVLVSPTKEGYTFDGWYDNAECTGTALTEIGATDYTADFTLYAKWTLNKYSFTIGVTPTSYGNVDVASITQIPHGSAVTVTDNKFTVNGTTVTATPTATTAEYTYAFSKWNNVPNTVTANVTNITAEFTRTINQYTLTVEANNDAMGTVSGGGTYDYNTVRTITASPKDGYKFVQWNDESTDNPRTVTVTANATYTATFDYDIANYTVKHWKQNIYDDDYTEEVADRQTNLSGTIGAQTNAEAKTYTGFTAQPISQQTIVVEGTTVVNIYYNRNTYTIEWQVDGVTKKNETVRYGATPSYGDDPTKAETAQYTYSFSGWSPTPYAADKDQTYSGSFNASVHYYTITWKNWNGEDLRSDYLQYGAQVTYGGSTPTKTDSETERSYTFKGWSPEVVDVAGDATYTAQFDLALTIGEGEHPYEVSGEETATITTVLVQGALKVPDGNNLTTNDLIIKASANNSGDIEGVENVSVTGHAYFDYVFDVDAWHWSAFGVPFEIDLDEFAPLKEKTTPMVLGTDYDIVYYNTKTRAQQGPGKRNWEYVENHEHKLIPGMAYLIAFNHPVGHVNTVRFTKASSAPINYTTAVPLTVTGAKGGDNNWNGIANPKMYHALLDAGVEECQVHDSGPIGGDGYDLYTMKSGETDYKFFVGKAAFVQTPQSQSTVEIDPATNQSPLAKHNAPRRAGTFYPVNPKYDIRIAPMDGEMADRLFIRAEEGKEDDYVIVADLAKAGVSPARAQIWVDRYGVKLCKNTTALINDMATYPLGISVPQAGEYSLYMANEVAEDDNLYLTYDGRVIWNLGYAPYILSLEKGVNEHYGLRLIHNTPAMEMDVEQVEATRAAQKMLIDQKVYILRGEQLYYITGQKAE